MNKSSLTFHPLTESDFTEVEKLQPENWGSIMPAIKWYLTLNFSYVIKAVMDNEIVGCGAVLKNGDSAWLANIIVARHHRNKGYGAAITNHILEHAKRDTHNVLLVATELGRPVYEKFGFKPDGEYVFFKAGKIAVPLSPYIIKYEPQYREAMLALDADTFGEDRIRLLEPYLQHALLFVKDDTFEGFAMPSLGEGLTLAYTDEAGLALMAARFAEEKRACLPKANQTAINYLMDHGFEVDEMLQGTKMYIGNRLTWKPQQQYGRVGGNMG